MTPIACFAAVGAFYSRHTRHAVFVTTLKECDNDRRMGFGSALAWAGANRDVAVDLASHIDCPIGDRSRHRPELVIGGNLLGVEKPWIRFLSGTGAIVLTFLAGAELDPAVFKRKWKEAVSLGAAGFLVPFFACAAA
jgi:hypothetical protein